MESILNLAFPFQELSSNSIVLNKVSFVDEEELRRIAISIEKSGEVRRCTQIVKSCISNANEYSNLVNFIENPTKTEDIPLLCSIPTGYDRIKIGISLKDPNTAFLDKRQLVIIKSVEKDLTPEVIKKCLDESYCSTETEVSFLNYRDLLLGTVENSDHRIVINDVFTRNKFQGRRLNVSLLGYDSDVGEAELLIKFAVWVETKGTAEVEGKQESKDEKMMKETEQELKISLSEEIEQMSRLSDYRRAFNIDLQDGPLFRDTLQHYENEIAGFKRAFLVFEDETKTLERLIKHIHNSRKALSDLANSIVSQRFYSFLDMTNFKKDLVSSFEDVFKQIEKNISLFVRDVCDPRLMSKVSSILINNLGGSDSSSLNELLHLKKQFEHSSKDYYSWLQKYLSNERERPELKLLVKRKLFELSKLDYYNSLNMVLNNQYSNALLENFMKFIQMDKDKKQNMSHTFSTTALPRKYIVNLAAISKYNSEKLQLRQLIESSKSNEELTDILTNNSLHFSDGDKTEVDEVITTDNIDIIFGSTNRVKSFNNHKSIAEDQNADISGILYTLGGQGKQGWHKEWVTLSGGQLQEYSDWRKGTGPINEPIEIALSSVKPISYDKRQNCFEIFTSKGNKHVFQAINETDRNKWIKALYNAGQVVDTARLDIPVQKEDKNKRRFLKLVTELGNPSKTMASQPLDRTLSPTRVLSESPLHEKDYLNLVRLLPERHNNICSDCGSNENVEWVSINFLVVFCVKCSSCHRSLGSHLNKTKSLKLDNFENEMEFLLKYVNNQHVNSYLEATLHSSEKPSVDEPLKSRLEFIKSKYVHKKFALTFDNVNDLLVKAVQKNDIEEVLKYISCGGDVNMKLQITSNTASSSLYAYLFEYSLRKYTEITDGITPPKKLFLISELLVLNGCRICQLNLDPKVLSLLKDAIDYWKARSNKLRGE